jgi:hypothetical protein
MGNEKLKIIVDDRGKTTIWMNGEIVHGVRRITFEHDICDVPVHTIEFCTPRGGLREPK